MSAPVSHTTQGFAPLLGAKPKLLILGSLPSVRSISEQQYYGHPRNRFWPVMGHLLGFDPQLDYAQRVSTLTSAGIAVWDVLASGVRPGSLDADIQRASEVCNPIAELLTQYASITHMFFNGRVAEQSFRRHVRLTAHRSPDQHVLPSTSPANAAWPLPRLIEAWSEILNALRTDKARR